MATFDQLLLDPSPADLRAALAQAVTVANEEWTAQPVELAERTREAFLAEAQGLPEGYREWGFMAEGQPVGLLRGPVVLVSWWTDHLVRRHYRIIGQRRTLDDLMGESPLLAYPLAHLYPERVVLRTRDGRDDLLVVCACGAAGTPAALAWTGPCCGPCHDRREEGSEAIQAHWSLRCGPGRSPWRLAFTRDGKLVAGFPRGVTTWDLSDGKAEDFPEQPGEPSPFVALSPDGTLALLELPDGLAVCDLFRRQATPFTPPTTEAEQAAFSHDGRWLALAGRPNYLIDLTGSSVPVPWGDRDEADLVAFNPDGKAVYAAGLFGKVTQLDIPTRHETFLPAGTNSEVLLPLMDESSSVAGLTCSPDGRWLAVSCWGDYGGGFRVCHLPTGQWSPLLPEKTRPQPEDPDTEEHGGHEHTDLGSALAFSPDSSTLAVAGAKGLVSFWDVAGGREVGRLRWQGSWLVSLCFSPEGQLLATGEGEQIRLWPWRRLLDAG